MSGGEGPDDERHDARSLMPGEIVYGDGPVLINEGKDVIALRVENTGDRPVQVGSHYHFAETNVGGVSCCSSLHDRTRLT